MSNNIFGKNTDADLQHAIAIAEIIEICMKNDINPSKLFGLDNWLKCQNEMNWILLARDTAQDDIANMLFYNEMQRLYSVLTK